MQWYYAEDIYYYYSEENRNYLIAPTEEELIQKLRQGKPVDVLAPYLPPQRLRPLFNVVELPNKATPFTSQERSYIESFSDQNRKQLVLNKILQSKLGLRVYTELSSINLIGLDNVRRYIAGIKNIQDEKLKPKGVFLVGVPGTGKSYSAKFCAKVLEGYLVEFNVSQILESPNPVFTLHNVFRFLTTMDKPVVLWIDEIEKAFTGQENEKRVFGQLLTILSDLNTPTGYKVNGLIWATANNIVDIMNRNPEFLRRGRFDELFFVDNPKLHNAQKIANHYQKVYSFSYPGDFGKDLVKVVREVVYITETNISGSAIADRFLYTPAEIEQVAKQMALRERLKKVNAEQELLYPEEILSAYGLKPSKDALDESDLIVVVSQISPISSSMQEAISVMRGQAKLFTPAD